jgi:release factor glutamine methyltransferase
MQWLVAKQLGCSRIALYTQFDRPLSEEELAPLRDLLKRRGEYEPLQHLLGTVEFAGHEFHCDERALVPRPETEELVEHLCTQLREAPPNRILDVGTGSGVIGLSLFKFFAGLAAGCSKEVVMSDLSPAALALARENADLLGADPILVESDLFEAIEGRFDLIVANLPYIGEGERGHLAKEVLYDPPSALFAGADGLDLLRCLIPGALTHLNPGGTLALEIGFDQEPAVSELLRSAGYGQIVMKNDLAGNPRFAFARPTDSTITPRPY